MNIVKKSVIALAVASMSLGTAAGAAVIDFGFALDESSSVRSNDFALTRQGLANALDQIPTSGANKYRISVVGFASRARTVIPPTVVDASNVAGLKSTIQTFTRIGGGTNIAASVDLLTANFVGVGLGAESYLNVATDGGSSAFALARSAEAAELAGIDGLSFEAIGSGASTNVLLRSCFGANSYDDPGSGNTASGCSLVSDPTLLPDATQKGFVLEIASFTDFGNAISAKVGSIVDDTGGGDMSPVPLPAAAWMLLAGLGALRVAGRRKA